MTDAAAFEATFTDWRLIKGRKVVQVILEVPLELADRAYQALGGMPDPAGSVWVAVARLNTERQVMSDKSVLRGDNELPAPNPQPARAYSLAQRVAMTCADARFQRYLTDNYIISEPNEELAANAVRSICKVRSRSEIVIGSDAAHTWDDLYGCYLAWRDAPELVP